MTSRPTAALPLDVFRVLVGLLCIPYFARLLLEVPDWAAEDGFLDHVLLRRIFWYTRLTLFWPGMGTALIYLTLLLGLVAAVGLVVGERPRLCAILAWVVAVCYFRWTFLVINLDDTGVQMLLFWCMLLPLGNTLRLADYLRARPQVSTLWRDWARVTVPMAALYCFYANWFLYYLVAGLTKWGSPMWRDGSALFVSLRLPLTWMPDFWGERHLVLLRALDYATLVLEPLFPFMLLLPRGHLLKWLGLVTLLGFHAGIILTIGVAYANMALVICAVLAFREEIMQWVQRRLLVTDAAQIAGGRASRLEPAVGTLFVLVLAVSMTRGVPMSGDLYNVGFGLQWCMGMAQEYHVFDWIDTYDYRPSYQVRFIPRGQRAARDVATRDLLPNTTRCVLMQAYLYYVRWQSYPECLGGELRRTLLVRVARRYARLHPAAGRVEVDATVREMGSNPHRDARVQQVKLMRFEVMNGQAVMLDE